MLGNQRNKGRRAILEQIRKRGPIPRIDLVARTRISRATVTTVTAELLECGLIEEVDAQKDGQELRRGRPRIDLQIRGDAFVVAGAKLANKSISIVLCDFSGKVLAESFSALPNTTFSETELNDRLSQELEVAAMKAKITPADVSAFGLGLSGLVDVVEGVVRWSPSLTKRDIRLSDSLSRRLGCPAFIDNDANLVAKAEQLFGLGKNVNDFIVITIEQGVGMGIVLGGELYRGTRGCGAEFGHTKVHLDGALCRCGQRGCLEAYVADYAVLREMAMGRELKGTRQENPKDMAALIELARKGERNAVAVLERASKMLAMGLSNLVNLFDPHLIILSGARVGFEFPYTAETIEQTCKTIVQVNAPPPKIVVHRWGDMMWAMGAAAYAIESLEKITLKELADHVA